MVSGELARGFDRLHLLVRERKQFFARHPVQREFTEKGSKKQGLARRTFKLLQKLEMTWCMGD